MLHLVRLFCAASVDGDALFGSRPNVVVLLADDLGYGDIAAFGGHPTSDTPQLDALVAGGMRFTSMYSSSPVCSPSRSSVMTGRLMTRNGVWPGVFSPNSRGGLALNETTLPQLLRDKGGYDTFMVGKWHLGVGEGGQYLPYHRGFQHYHGVPYGVDMCSLVNIGIPCLAPNVSCGAAPFAGGASNYRGRPYDVPCPYFVNDTIVEQPTALLTIDEKYVNATRAFIMAHAGAPATAAAPRAPFFVYFCSHHTHVPVFANSRFTNSSSRGWFGDHLRMLDWSVGEVVQAVRDAQLEQQTLVLFSADNGPSLTWENLGGNGGQMRCGKGTTWEGGQRGPGIAYWPGTIRPSSTSHDIVSSMDFFATALALAGVEHTPDAGHNSDSIDFSQVLVGQQGRRQTFYYWGKSPNRAVGLHAIRHGDWKMHWVRQGSHCTNRYPDPWCYQPLTKLTEPLLYNLAVDVGEVYNLSLAAYADIHSQLSSLKALHEAEGDIFGPSEMHLGGDDSLQPCANRSPACAPHAADFPVCCQTNYTPAPAPPAPTPSQHCMWNGSTNLGLVNSSADRHLGSIRVTSKEGCCGACIAAKDCRSAHYMGTVCNLWSAYDPRNGTGVACVPNGNTSDAVHS